MNISTAETKDDPSQKQHSLRKEKRMNKKNKNTIDNSTPYRNLGMNKITAPAKQDNEPSARVIKSESDLRVRGGKA